MIDNAFFLEHTDQIFKKYKLLKIKDIFHSKCLSLYYNIKKGLIPASLNNLVTTYQPNHSRNLRSTNSTMILNPYHTSMSTSERSLKYYLPQFINTCPSILIEAINSKSINSYKKFIKNSYIENYSSSICKEQSCYACQLKYQKSISTLFLSY